MEQSKIKFFHSALYLICDLAPLDGCHCESNPTESNPIESYPMESNPIESNPIKSNPIESNPI